MQNDERRPTFSAPAAVKTVRVKSSLFISCQYIQSVHENSSQYTLNIAVTATSFIYQLKAILIPGFKSNHL